MKYLLAFIALAVLHAGCVWGQGQPTPQTGDEAAIRTIVNHWQQNWDRFDASVLQGDYADDADWLNAFGVRKKGGAEIVAYVAMVVKRPQNHERHTTWSEPRIRFVRPDVAIAYRDYQTGGNKAPDGRDLPDRRTHATWVLTKTGGKWLIVSHVISDENGR
ncbi:MAG TPA: SgcJ/EcaC family oxidoreductase [Candidatus Limnocylindrales bacterium]|nr:SgcJ/EcaC family oxidoreductase [Candidatus Limnocylindrales bacterium]